MDNAISAEACSFRRAGLVAVAGYLVRRYVPARKFWGGAPAATRTQQPRLGYLPTYLGT